MNDKFGYKDEAHELVTVQIKWVRCLPTPRGYLGSEMNAEYHIRKEIQEVLPSWREWWHNRLTEMRGWEAFMGLES